MNIEMIKANNLLAGQYFFSRDTMRFFHSRVFATIYQGKYFITSEVNPSGEKRYSIREAIDGGKKIRSVEWFKYNTLNEAKQVARTIGVNVGVA